MISVKPVTSHVMGAIASRPLKIALIVNSFPKTSETFILRKAVGLAARGMDVHIITQKASRSGALAELHENGNTELEIEPGLLSNRATILPRTLRYWSGNPVRAGAVWQEARRHYGHSTRAIRAWMMAIPILAGRFDVAHFELSGLAVTHIDALPLLRGTRLFMSCRGAAEQIVPVVDAGRAPALRRVSSFMDRIHCVSEDIRATMQSFGIDESKLFVNRPAVDAETFRRTERRKRVGNSPFRLLSVGRLHWKKGLEYGIQAVRMLADRGFDVRYDIVGSGAEEEKLRHEVHDLGLQKVVALHGARPVAAVRTFLDSADLFLLPSLSEGLSNAVLEAMSMEVPVISTTAGGMAELIRDGTDGLLVRPRVPQEMAARAAELLGDDRRRHHIGRAGRDRVVEAFTLDRQIETFVDEYLGICRRT